MSPSPGKLLVNNNQRTSQRGKRGGTMNPPFAALGITGKHMPKSSLTWSEIVGNESSDLNQASSGRSSSSFWNKSSRSNRSFGVHHSRSSSSNFKVKMDFRILENKLYGRAIETRQLTEAYTRTREPRAPIEIVFIRGVSGVGKTALIEHWKASLVTPTKQSTATMSAAELRGAPLIVSGKYQQLSGTSNVSEPFSALKTTFCDLLNDLAISGTEQLEDIKAELQETLRSQPHQLFDMLPPLSKLIRQDGYQGNFPRIESTASPGSTSTLIQLQLVLVRILRAVCRPTCPVVMILDDLQWADEASLDFIAHLLRETECNNFMLVGCFRKDASTENGWLETSWDRPNLERRMLQRDSNRWMAAPLSTSRRLFLGRENSSPAVLDSQQHSRLPSMGSSVRSISSVGDSSRDLSSSALKRISKRATESPSTLLNASSTHSDMKGQSKGSKWLRRKSGMARANGSDHTRRQRLSADFGDALAETIAESFAETFAAAFSRQSISEKAMPSPAATRPTGSLRRRRMSRDLSDAFARPPLARMGSSSHSLGSAISRRRRISTDAEPSRNKRPAVPRRMWNSASALPQAKASVNDTSTFPNVGRFSGRSIRRSFQIRGFTKRKWSKSEQPSEPTISSESTTPPLPQLHENSPRAIARRRRSGVRGLTKRKWSTSEDIPTPTLSRLSVSLNAALEKKPSKRNSYFQRNSADLPTIASRRVSGTIATNNRRRNRVSRTSATLQRFNVEDADLGSAPPIGTVLSRRSGDFAFDLDSLDSDDSFKLIDQDEVINVPDRQSSLPLSFQAPVLPALTDIKLTNLNFASINDIVSELTQMKHEDCSGLAMIVARKTHGNADSVIRFIERLQNDELIAFNFQSAKWEWDGAKINSSTKVTANVGEFLVGNVKSLSYASRELLKLASCIGLVFDDNIVEIVAREEDTLELNSFSEKKTGDSVQYDSNLTALYREKLEKALQESQRLGLLTQDFLSSRYRFSHDVVHQCFVSMLPAEDMDFLHLRIGRVMRRHHSFGIEKRTLFATAGHLNRGSSNIEADDERIDLINLNLKAAGSSKEALSFYAALEFLEKAISLIVDSDWIEHYDLVLDVHTSAAQTANSCCKLSRSIELAETVIRNARCVEDKIEAHFILVDILGVQGNLSKAIEESFRVLKLLRCKVPRWFTRLHHLIALVQIKRMLRGKESADDLLYLVPMTDTNKIQTIKALDSLSRVVWLAAQDSLVSLAMAKMMLITLQHGISNYAPFCFASYGILLSHMGDSNRAFAFGSTALEFAESLQSKVSLTRTIYLVYTFTNHLKRPLIESLEPMLNAHRIGMEVGDVEDSSMCLAQYSALYICVGLPLVPFEEDMKNFCEQLERYNQDHCVALILPYWHFALKMMDKSDSLFSLTGNVVENYDCEKAIPISLPDEDQGMTKINLRFVNRLLIYIFQRDKMMVDMWAGERENRTLINGTHFLVYMDILITGLIDFRVYRLTGRRRYLTHARHVMATMRRLVEQSGINCHSMYLLLLAEEKSFSADPVRARAHYDPAIACLSRCGFTHLVAIACERAGDCMARFKDSYWTRIYYSRAAARYNEWGAVAKADELEALHDLEDSRLLSDDRVRINFRGRSRFDGTTFNSISERSSCISFGD